MASRRCSNHVLPRCGGVQARWTKRQDVNFSGEIARRTETDFTTSGADGQNKRWRTSQRRPAMCRYSASVSRSVSSFAGRRHSSAVSSPLNSAATCTSFQISGATSGEAVRERWRNWLVTTACKSPPLRSGRRGRWFKSSRPDWWE